MAPYRLVVLALGLLLGIAQPAAWSATTVTYVANETFLIEAGGEKILIDPFADSTLDSCHVPDSETVARIGAADPPFNGIDLILVTHAHVDHFGPGLVLRHLAANPGAVVVAPSQAAEVLRAEPAWAEGYDERVTVPELDLYESLELTLRGIHVVAHRVRHSRYMIHDEASGEMRNKHEGVENLAYLIDASGVKMMHVGDALLRDNREYLSGLEYGPSRVDLLFIGPWHWPEEVALAQEWMSPEKILFMHLAPAEDLIDTFARQVGERVPTAVVFRKPMERMELRLPEDEDR